MRSCSHELTVCINGRLLALCRGTRAVVWRHCWAVRPPKKIERKLFGFGFCGNKEDETLPWQACQRRHRMGGARGNKAERCDDLVLVNWETDNHPRWWQIWQRGAWIDMARCSGGDQTGATVTVQMVVTPQLTSGFEVHPASSVAGSRPVSSYKLDKTSLHIECLQTTTDSAQWQWFSCSKPWEHSFYRPVERITVSASTSSS
jgi:hypothetical protein